MADETEDEAQRDALCDAAVAYAAAEWSIIPTRPPVFRDPVCRRSPASPQIAHGWWSEALYGIACPKASLWSALTSRRRSCASCSTTSSSAAAVARTLEALSVALGWHPRHLTAVLHGRRPREPGDPLDDEGEGTPARLAAIEDRLSEIAERLEQISANLTTVVDRVAPERRR